MNAVSRPTPTPDQLRADEIGTDEAWTLLNDGDAIDRVVQLMKLGLILEAARANPDDHYRPLEAETVTAEIASWVAFRFSLGAGWKASDGEGAVIEAIVQTDPHVIDLLAVIFPGLVAAVRMVREGRKDELLAILNGARP